MASPQVEKGFTRIAHELLKAMARANIRGNEFMVMLAIVTKTYGWNKTRDQISLTQFSEITQLDRANCARAIRSLIQMNMVGSVKGDTTKSTTYFIQKDYDKWRVDLKVVSKRSSVKGDTICSVSGDTRGSVKTRGKVVSNAYNTQNTITKDTIKDTLKDTVSVIEYESEFEKLWLKYPNKDGKKAAFVHFKASVKTLDDLAAITKALDNYLKSRRVKGNFIKNGSTWFNNWRDWIEPPSEVDREGGMTEYEIGKLIEKELGKMAAVSSIKKVMGVIPQDQWFKIDEFLNKRYPGGGDGYRKALYEMRDKAPVKEVNKSGIEAMAALTSKIGQGAAKEDSPWEG